MRPRHIPGKVSGLGTAVCLVLSMVADSSSITQKRPAEILVSCLSLAEALGDSVD
jgi:hypothetical protein